LVIILIYIKFSFIKKQKGIKNKISSQKLYNKMNLIIKKQKYNQDKKRWRFK
jgi:hypothetical protein